MADVETLRERGVDIAFDFEVEKAGRYKFSAILLDNVFGGRYQPLLDDQPLGPVLDMCSKGGDWREYVFDLHDLESGTHTFKLSGRGSSPLQRTIGPKLYSVGISSLILLRMEDMPGFQR